ncbi:hypothetical protein [Rhizobium ruizarguesonis]|uniref:hypothetical protein n=1 Tax=Rhizobium ruizarguesonis TaxID=2081791 RepID=UPI00103177C2|nr:hypothetical protein [Rhizobium ruizarguesonis]TAY93617.1 hypothetical protein ELH85_10780 [Rhizobium ruizarguesonis]
MAMNIGETEASAGGTKNVIALAVAGFISGDTVATIAPLIKSTKTKDPSRSQLEVAHEFVFGTGLGSLDLKR